MGTDFAGISSCTALTRHVGLNTIYNYTEYMKSKYVQCLISKDLSYLYHENAYLHKSSNKT